VQNTLQEAQDRIDARIRNQQRHHDEDMRALYDRMTTFRGEGGQSSRSPHPNPSTQWNGETSEGSSDESSGSRVPTRSRPTKRTRSLTTRSQATEHARSLRTGRTRETSRRHSQHHHSTPFDEIPPPPLGDELREHISGFHPFTAEVMMARLPSRWQWPHMDTYDETMDPSTHVKSYMTQANLFSVDGRVHCRLFPTILRGPALDLYYSLPSNSINSFEMLCARFTARFADSKPASTSSASLQNVVQGDNESLRHYMTRFTRATLSILDLHPAVARHSLLVGLKPGPFLESLYADPPPNMDSLRTRATRYMSIEKNTKARKRRPQSITEGQRSQKRVRPGRFDRYTSLNTTREAVLQETCSLDLIRLPRPGRSQPGADPTLRCSYHQNIEHSTEDYTKVRDLIEELIQSGALAHFV